MIVRVLFAVLLVSGCAAERAQDGRASAPRAAPTPQSRAGTAAPAAPTPSGDRAAAAIEAALTEVVRVRRLPALRAIASKVIPRAELSERVKRDVLTELEPGQVQGITESLVALGVVPPDLDYLGTVLELLGSQVAGYYDPRDKAMFLLDDLGADAQAATLWHELVHAIQDQHYDLRPKLKWAPGKGDATAAVQSLAEGDATSAMLDVMMAAQGQTALDVPAGTFEQGIGMMEALPEIATIPAILKRSVVAPYVDGLAFVHALRRSGGWASVDAAWRSPPSTTEQLLHPEKYVARERASELPAPSAPALGPSDRVYADVLGEQGLRLLFEEWMPLATAARSASGWSGDHVAVFATGDRRAVAAHFSFDDEPAARRALEAFARGVLLGESEGIGGAARPRIAAEQAASAARSGRLCRARARRGPFAILRRGRDLAVALGPFQRLGGDTRAAGECAAALTWAAAILTPKR